MKAQLNPAVAGVIIVVVVIVIGFFVFKKAGGKTITKDEATGQTGIQMTAPANGGK